MLTLWSIPFSLAGVLLGARLASRVDPLIYRRYVARALIVSGLSLANWVGNS